MMDNINHDTSGEDGMWICRVRGAYDFLGRSDNKTSLGVYGR